MRGGVEGKVDWRRRRGRRKRRSKWLSECEGGGGKVEVVYNCDVKEQREKQEAWIAQLSFSAAAVANHSIKGSPLFGEVRKIRMGTVP